MPSPGAQRPRGTLWAGSLRFRNPFVQHPRAALRFLTLVIAMAAASVACAKPFVPATDDVVLEQLPLAANDPTARRLASLRAGLTQAPGDLTRATTLAREYVAIGRASGDPRYAGYAQAALAPWWKLDRPPVDVLMLRATLRQRQHDFPAALRDVGTVLAATPLDAQAHLMRATILTVQGDFATAAKACAVLEIAASELLWSACADGVGAMTGRLPESYRHLAAVLERNPKADPPTRVWVLTALAEMAERAGLAAAAERHFRDALRIEPDDVYLLAAYADFLLDQGRAGEVTPLLRNRTRADTLLLRAGLAAAATRSADAADTLEQLRSRFAASRLRGDRVHLREEARFTLELLGDAQAALGLALDNWAVQKEPGDALVLLQAAVGANDLAATQNMTDWVRHAGLQDARIEKILRKAHPRPV